MTHEHDLSTDELSITSKRIHRVLRKRPVTTYYGLQYQLCEVGQNRREPRELRRALDELVGNERPRRGRVSPGPRELKAGIFTSPTLGVPEAEDLIQQIDRALRAVPSLDWEEAIRTFAEFIGGADPSLQSRSIPSFPHILRPLTAESYFPAISTECILDGQSGSRVAVWISHDLDWIYPDDWRLWTFLRRSSDAAAAPLIIARKVSLGTFALLKSVGALTLQYYALLTSTANAERVQSNVNSLGWPYIRTPEELAKQQMAPLVRDAVARLARNDMSEQLATLVRVPTAEALGDPELSAPLLLLDWSEETGSQMPEAWQSAVRRWSEWSSYRRRTRAGASNKPISSDHPDASTLPPEHHATASAAQVSDEAPERDNSQSEKGFGRKTTVRRVPMRIN